MCVTVFFFTVVQLGVPMRDVGVDCGYAVHAATCCNCALPRDVLARGQ